jgi:hypothetical protein
MESDTHKAFTRRDLAAAIFGPCQPPRSNEEIAEQWVEKLQQGAVVATRGLFDLMRRHLPGAFAATAGELGDRRLSQAIASRLALLASQESTMIQEARSKQRADEARNWILRRLECGSVDVSDRLPRLAVWVGTVSAIVKDLFSDAYFDPVLEAVLHTASTMPKDDSPWVLVSKLQPARIESVKRRKRYVEAHPNEIRSRRPKTKNGTLHPKRLEVNLGDWVRHWDKVDRQAFDSLDSANHHPITPDELAGEDMADEFVAGATGLYSDIFKGKQPRE